jgi:hypothetical protein
MRYAPGFLALAGLALLACESRGPAVQPQGEPETPATQVLEAGAKLLQGEGPTDTLNVYLVGFHPLVDDPSRVMEAHHYCQRLNEDLIQCVLWDGNTNDANLIGVEHVISARLYEQLPAAERESWHPHDYEILSGQLVAPGMPPAADLALMRKLMNSYGKTWHVWHTGEDADDLPLGPARLAWSFNADNELDPRLLEERDRAMRIDSRIVRQYRQALVKLAEPQYGVDRLEESFPMRVKPNGVKSAD